MRTGLLTLALAFAAVAQDAPKDDGLILTSHRVDLKIHENLGLLDLQLKVKNPTDRPLEGDVSFSTSPGAVVFAANLLRHISSTERESKLLKPEQAAALYDADRNRPPEGAPAGGLSSSASSTPSAANAHSGFTGSRGINRPTATTVIPPAGARPVVGPALMIPRNVRITGTNMAGKDPALVELVSADRYRLRFFPVPPRDVQTLTVRIAFEVAKDGRSYAATVPLGLDSNFRSGPDSFTEGRLSLSSADALGTVTCSSHSLGAIRQDELGHRFTASLLPAANVRSLLLAYEPGFWAKPFDCSPDAVSGSSLSPEMAAALHAVRAGRALERADEAARPERALASGIVSAHGSFLVIERNEARDLARSEGRSLRPEAAGAPVSDEEAKDCEFIRALLKLPARSGAPRCEIHVVSTNEAAKLQWARDNGITSARGSALREGTTFEYVKHGAGCPVREPNVEKLKEAAGRVR
ncbi:MAG: hypothetical protein HY293_15605 [Planctomycetes bacterium]|nr:hypothetical protein [Planctomycetota bacterium]